MSGIKFTPSFDTKIVYLLMENSLASGDNITGVNLKWWPLADT
jgi:hypothetical protein